MKRWPVSSNSAPGPALLFSFLASPPHGRTKQRDSTFLALGSVGLRIENAGAAARRWLTSWGDRPRDTSPF
jgi:hypothetical protein